MGPATPDLDKASVDYEKALDELIEEELFYLEAVRRGITADKAEVEKVIAAEITRIGGRDKFEKFLAKSGKDIETITDTGSRWVTSTVASGKVVISGPNCSRCWGDFSTHRSRKVPRLRPGSSSFPHGTPRVSNR